MPAGIQELRDYQKECIDVVNSLPDGSRTVVALATGLGKTLVAASLDFHGRVLWLSHRDELVYQPEKYFSARGMSFGVEKAGKTSNCEDVVSASIQSISRDDRLQSFSPDAFDTIILDEAQHAVADTYKKVVHYFHPRKLIGLTATPRRADGQELDEIFDSVCFCRDMKWGILNGYLSDLRYLRITTSYHLTGVALTAGDYSSGDLSSTMRNSNNDSVTARAYIEHARGKQTLIYCPTIERCESVFRILRRLLPEFERCTVAMLSGTDDPDYRSWVINSYRRGYIHAIVNCMVLTEGTDLPSTEVIINDRPTKNDVLYEQIIGRGVRLYPGKESCLIIDILPGDWSDDPPCNALALFGIDPALLPDDCDKKISHSEIKLAENSGGLCKAQDSELGALLQRIDLSARTCLMLSEDFDAVIRSKAADGYKALAREIKDRIEPDDDDGLCVHRSYLNGYSRYIKSAFDGKIWISDPDDEGKVHAFFEIPHLKCISEPMEEKEMLHLIRAYLETTRKVKWFLWDKTSRRASECNRITDSQKKYIERLYRNDGMSGQTSELNRREADDLISWKTDQQKVQSELKKIMERQADSHKSPKSNDYRKWLKSAMAEERSRMNLSEVTKANWEQIKSRAEKSLTAAADSQQCG